MFLFRYNLDSLLFQKSERRLEHSFVWFGLDLAGFQDVNPGLRPSHVGFSPVRRGSVFQLPYTIAAMRGLTLTTCGTREQESQGRNKTGVNTGDIHVPDFLSARRMSLFRRNKNAIDELPGPAGLRKHTRHTLPLNLGLHVSREHSPLKTGRHRADRISVSVKGEPDGNRQ
jgi:hypothetical protein